MQEADDNHLLIEPHHLEAALARRTEGSPVEPIQPSRAPSQIVQHSDLSPATEAEADDGVLSDFPVLSIHKDGSIWRGDEEIEGWQMLGPLQRVFLQYLYDHRGQLCLKRDIIDHVWQDKVAPAGDDALRKLGERVIQFIEPDPLNPVYIQKVRGGHYRLDHAGDV
jgi:DNA-binding response OmpR family regulator